MKIKILGAASGMPDPELHHAAIWVKLKNTQVLFDCGEGTAGQMLSNSISGEVIDAIIITHFHPDHLCGIYMVLQMLYLQQRKKKLDIFLPERVKEFNFILEYHYLFLQKFTYPVNLWIMDDITARYPEITALQTDHLTSYRDIVNGSDLRNEMKSYALMIKESDKQVLYSSDIIGTEFLEQYLPDLDLLIIDALHPQAEDILGLTNSAGTRIILNHGMSPKLEEIFRTNTISLEKARENEEIII